MVNLEALNDFDSKIRARLINKIERDFDECLSEKIIENIKLVFEKYPLSAFCISSDAQNIKKSITNIEKLRSELINEKIRILKIMNRFAQYE